VSPYWLALAEDGDLFHTAPVRGFSGRRIAYDKIAMNWVLWGTDEKDHEDARRLHNAADHGPDGHGAESYPLEKAAGRGRPDKGSRRR
jgi:hypothetical protein